jgi:hypothetical protein
MRFSKTKGGPGSGREDYKSRSLRDDNKKATATAKAKATVTATGNGEGGFGVRHCRV